MKNNKKVEEKIKTVLQKSNGKPINAITIGDKININPLIVDKILYKFKKKGKVTFAK